MDDQQAPTPPVIDVEKRVGQFVRLRDLKAELKEKHDAEMKPINDAMEMMKNEFKQVLASTNATNIKTSLGTVSLLNKATASASDLSVFWTWVITQAAFDMIDKKPNVTAITEYVKQNGVAPPGVSYSEYQDIGVRRK